MFLLPLHFKAIQMHMYRIPQKIKWVSKTDFPSLKCASVRIITIERLAACWSPLGIFFFTFMLWCILHKAHESKYWQKVEIVWVLFWRCLHARCVRVVPNSTKRSGKVHSDTRTQCSRLLYARLRYFSSKFWTQTWCFVPQHQCSISRIPPDRAQSLFNYTH